MVRCLRLALRASALGAALTAAPAIALPADEACGLLPPGEPAPAGKRPIEAADLVELRDTGWPDGRMVGEPPMTISPDGRRFAFHLRRADVERDGYCHGIVVMEIDGRAAPRLIDTGGEPVRGHYELGGIAEFPDGSWTVLTPRWSPDGRFVAYLRRTDGVTQVWRAAADGSGAGPVTASLVDVLDFAWLSDREIVFSSRPELLAFRAALEEEAKQGFLYDGRFFASGSARPLAVEPLAEQVRVVAVGSGEVREADAGEQSVFRERAAGISPREPLVAAGNDERRRAWTQSVDPEGIRVPIELRVEWRGRPIPCPHQFCRDYIRGLWWLSDDDLLILQQQGVNRGELALYRWEVTGPEPRRLLWTEDLLMGCQIHGGEKLLCLHEGATVPRRFVTVDAGTGAIEPVLDLNPELAGVALQPSTRLRWTNSFGNDAYGDLVLPPDRRPGERLPLVITQYRSRGFLRGGTGDEVPVQMLAQAGFAVLSTDKPYEFAPDARSFEEYYAAYYRDFAGRRNNVSSLEAGIRETVEMGLVDPARVGITGLSDGSTTATFALINTDLFAAASLSSCCEEPVSYNAIAGPGWQRLTEAIGYPSRDDPQFDPFWAALSLARNAERIRVPLLLQLADWEFRLALETHSALAAAGKPVEMYVFDGEFHLKNGPRHRAAIYERNLDWFNYWLRGARDEDPAKEEQYHRWDALPRP